MTTEPNGSGVGQNSVGVEKPDAVGFIRSERNGEQHYTPMVDPFEYAKRAIGEWRHGDGFAFVFQFGANEPELAVRLRYDGSMEYGPNYKPDEAAQNFWESMREQNPYLQVVLQSRLMLMNFVSLLQKLADTDREQMTVADVVSNFAQLQDEVRVAFDQFGLIYNKPQAVVDNHAQTC